MAFVDCLEQMGCEVRRDADSITVIGRPLRGIDVDMNAISDTVQTLAVVALFADGPTTIRNVAHIRHKETDRIAAVATELRKLGVEVDGATGWLDDSARQTDGRDDRHLQRSPHGDELRARRAANSGRADQQSASASRKRIPRFFEDLEALVPETSNEAG